MSVQNGPARTGWKPGPGLSAFGRRALDLLLPATAGDGSPALSPGLTAEAWARIAFLDDPVCDQCGAFPLHGAFEVREGILFGPSGKAVKMEVTMKLLKNGDREFNTVITKGSAGAQAKARQ